VHQGIFWNIAYNNNFFMSSTLIVFIYALITAVATGLGVIPFLFRKNIPDSWIACGNVLAAALMIAASFSLIYEGFAYNGWLTLVGAVIGVAFIYFAHEFVESRPNLSVANLPKAGALSAIMIVGIMTLHSFAEGIGIGVSFGGGDALGQYISTALAIHNIPEGLAIALVLIPLGIRLRTVFLLAILSSLPQPLIAVPAYLFADVFLPFLPFGLGLAAGAMIWMSLSELLPSAFESDVATHEGLATLFTIGVVVMLAFQLLTS